jgi:hypothetical protein
VIGNLFLLRSRLQEERKLVSRAGPYLGAQCPLDSKFRGPLK